MLSEILNKCSTVTKVDFHTWCIKVVLGTKVVLGAKGVRSVKKRYADY